MVVTGFIGCGGMGQTLARWVHTLPLGEIVAGADPSEAARRDFAAAYGAEPYADHRQLLERTDLDAVFIATPHNLHLTHVLDAAASERHIFLEKPMGLSVAECDRMIEAARRHDVKLMVGQVLRLIPLYAKAIQLATSGALGRPISVDISRIEYFSLTGWWKHRAAIGGLMFATSVHEFDFMRALFGEAESIYAVAAPQVRDDMEYSDNVMAIVRFKNGATGSLHASHASFLGNYDGKILCTDGTVFYGGSQGLVYGDREGSPVKVSQQKLDRMEDGFRWEIRSFLEWITEGKEPVVTAQDGRTAVEMVQAAYLSIERGDPVNLPL